MTISKATDLLLLECKSRGLSHRTIGFYIQRRDKLISLIGDQHVGTLTIHHLRDALTKTTPRSAPHLFVYIKRLFGFLTAEDVLKTDPTVKLKRPKVQKLVTVPLTSEQIAKCYAVAKGYPGYTALRDATMFALLVGTGLRREELCLLKDTDVCLSADPPVLIVNGKGQKQRLVPLTRNLVKILSKYHALRGETRVYGKAGQTFFRDRTGKPLAPEALTQIIARIGRNAGIRLHPHLLRHSFCTHFMANDGADVLTLQSIAGWSTIQMADRYAKSQMPKLRRSMESFSPANDL